jgi:hypothetical protein
MVSEAMTHAGRPDSASECSIAMTAFHDIRNSLDTGAPYGRSDAGCEQGVCEGHADPGLEGKSKAGPSTGLALLWLGL